MVHIYATVTAILAQRGHAAGGVSADRVVVCSDRQVDGAR
jgi:hypothetical protein